jgi:hypothetical protein
VEEFGEEESGALSNDCWLSRGVAPSSSQLNLYTPLKARPLMKLVFRASKNCSTVGLLFEPQYKYLQMCSQGDPDSDSACEGA